MFPKLARSVGLIKDDHIHHMMLLIMGAMKHRQNAYFNFYASTAEGKTTPAEQTINFIDYRGCLNQVIEAVETSNEFLKYAGGDDGKGMKNKFIWLDETEPTRPGEDDRKQALMRQLDSENRESFKALIVDKTGPGGKLGLAEHTVERPAIFVMTSTARPEKWDPQTRNRTEYIDCTKTQDQIQAVINIGAEDAEDVRPHVDKELIYRGFNCFLHGLRRYDRKDPEGIHFIKIPYFSQIVTKWDKQYLVASDARRSKLLRRYIERSALLHQHLRQIIEPTKDEKRRILIATIDDYANIRDVFERVVPRVVEQAGHGHFAHFKLMYEMLHASEKPMSRKDITAQSGGLLTPDKLAASCPQLLAARLIEVVPGAGEDPREHHYRLGKRFNDALQLARVRHQAASDADQLHHACKESIADAGEKLMPLIDPLKLTGENILSEDDAWMR